jgi:hypothetical protein
MARHGERVGREAQTGGNPRGGNRPASGQKNFVATAHHHEKSH